MIHNSGYLFFTAFIATQLTHVMSVDGIEPELQETSRKCYTTFPKFHANCASQCPGIFPAGRCLQLKIIKRCFCGRDDDKNLLYTVREAKKTYSFCNNEVQNLDGCRSLCPNDFPFGACEIVNEVMQCGCKQAENAVATFTWKEAKLMSKVCNRQNAGTHSCNVFCPPGFTGTCMNREGHFTCYCVSQDQTYNPDPFLYTIPNSKNIYRACNSRVQDPVKCRELCPFNFELATCDEKDRIWGCRCAHQRHIEELYSLSDAKRIHQACYDRDNEGACSELCPQGLHGQCVYIHVGRGQRTQTCGCKTNLAERAFYTVSKANEMNRFCKHAVRYSRESREECSRLCPEMFQGGDCICHDDSFCECVCKRTADVLVDDWIPLTDAIEVQHIETARARRQGSGPRNWVDLSEE